MTDVAGGGVRTADKESPARKMMKTEDGAIPTDAMTAPPTNLEDGQADKARKVRLEQNRKAARESRKRKKIMIEELQVRIRRGQCSD